MGIIEILEKIQKELKAPKSQFNKFGGFNYRSCEDILEAVKPLIPEGVILNISDDIVMVGDRFYVKATAALIMERPDTETQAPNSIQATAVAREPVAKKGMDESQITGAASSYARKYALNGLFAIDDTKDADTQDNSKETKTTSKPTAKKPTKEDTPDTALKCSQCGKDITPAEANYSLGKYKAKLCRDCQKVPKK